MSQIVVITRFNIRIKHKYRKLYAKSKEIDLCLNEDYLEKRFDLFERYTLPSFLTQTDQDYLWIVLFHKETPERFLRKIRDYKGYLKEFEPLFLDDSDSAQLDKYLYDHLKAYHISNGVITARVDNDDVVHKRFIESIRQALKDCEGTIGLSFKNGLQYDVSSRRCMRYSYVNNHFVSVYSCEHEKFVGALSFNHTKMDRVLANRIVEKTKVPMWVEIVHDTNCVNEIWCRPSKVFVPFCVKEEYPFLDIKWSNRPQWIWGMISYLPVAFIKMFIDVIRLIMIKVRE